MMRAINLLWLGCRAVLFCAALLLVAIDFPSPASAAGRSYSSIIARVQPRIVKVYGAGGVRGLESYQSGFLVSAEGHVLTAWSYVLDTDLITVVLNDGRRFEATMTGADPRLEIAMLKIEAEGLEYFELDQDALLTAGARVLAFSNVFGVAAGNEPASVLHGHVAAVTELNARRGVYQTPYRGPAYVLDAMTNNPGAAGGALTDGEGTLVGLIGKELRSAQDNTWLNYAIPVREMREAVLDLQAGRMRPREVSDTDRKPLEPATLASLGIVLIPDVLPQTPPYVDHVEPGSPAEQAGLQPDDMILFVNDRLTRSARDLRDELSYIDRIDEVRLLVQRGQSLQEFSLFAAEP